MPAHRTTFHRFPHIHGPGAWQSLLSSHYAGVACIMGSDLLLSRLLVPLLFLRLGAFPESSLPMLQ